MTSFFKMLQKFAPQPSRPLMSILSPLKKKKKIKHIL